MDSQTPERPGVERWGAIPIRGTRRPAASVNTNDSLAFFVELGALALLAWLGVHLGTHLLTRLALGIGLAATAAVLWGLFAAPRARYQHLASTVVVKLLVLGGAAVAGFWLLPITAAITFAVIAAANLTLMYAGPFAR